MQTYSRRQVLIPLVAMPYAIAAANCRSVFGSKRMGTSEESMKEFSDWLRKEKLSISETSLDNWERQLSFALNPAVKSLAGKLASRPEGEHFIRDKDQILLISFPDEDVVVGTVRKNSLVGDTHVYVLSRTEGEVKDGILGRTFNEAKVILIYEDKLREFAQYEMGREHLKTGMLSKSFQIPQVVLDQHANDIQAFITPAEPSADEYFSLARRISLDGGVPEQNALKMLLAIALYVRDARANNKFKTEDDREKAIHDMLYDLIFHELIHAKLKSRLAISEEVFPLSAELSYGKRPFHQLALMMYVAVQGESAGVLNKVTEHGGSEALILQALQGIGFGPVPMLTESDPEHVHEIARKMLHKFCVNNFNAPFEEVFDLGVLEQVKQLAESK